MTTATEPAADIVFENLDEGDEDFTSEQCGHLNISLAYRELKRAGAPIISCHVPRAEIPKYRELRDIDPTHVERLKQQWPEPKERPVLLGELQPGSLTLIDGVHRLMAHAAMEPLEDPIRLNAYVVPHAFLPLLQISVYLQHADGRREPVDVRAYVQQFWGRYTDPKPRG
jgi:hypothetical protein